MDQILIVKAKDVLRLNNFRRFWMLGWMVASAALVLAAIQTVRVHEHQKNLAELQAMTDRIETVAHQQELVNANFVKAFEAQNHTADLLISWGTFVKERTDMANQNNKNAPFTFASSTGHR